VNLVVEADGSQHQEQLHRENDAERDSFLNANELRVLRFDNRQILTETDSVMEAIYQICCERLTPHLGKGGAGGISISAKNQIPLNPPLTKGDF
jgi:very-short-patch-repair endonuclease